MYKKPPIYKVESEGEPHQPKFRCKVEVGGQQFSSAGSFDRKKEAEQDAARVAYEILAAVGEDDIKEAVELIDQVHLLTPFDSALCSGHSASFHFMSNDCSCI